MDRIADFLKRVNWRSAALFLTSAGGVAALHALIQNEKIVTAVGIVAGLILTQTAPLVRTEQRITDPPGTIPTPSGPAEPSEAE